MKQSEAKLDLYEITSTKSGFYGKVCGLCRKKCIKGDVVLGQVQAWFSVAMHTRCLKTTLEQSPLDKFELLKEQIASTGGIFSE